VNPENWTNFDTALEWARRTNLGVGFVLGGGWGGIDLDGCVRDNGEVEEWAAKLIEMANSYAELSPSGRGIHILIRAPEQDSIQAHDEGVEAYFRDRFFTLTGKRWGRAPREVREAPALVSFLRAHYGEKTPEFCEESGVSILKVLEAFGATLPRRGRQLQGTHPVHGSTTGMNFAVHPEKGAWYCFRHGVGGGPFTLVGILAKVISCEDVKALTQEQISIITEEAKKRGLLEGKENKQKREVEFELLKGYKILIRREGRGFTALLLDSSSKCVDIFSLSENFWTKWKDSKKVVSRLADKIGCGADEIKEALTRISILIEEEKKKELAPPQENAGEGENSAYELLQKLADEKVKELFRDEEGEVCATVEEDGHLEVWPVRGEVFDSKLNVWFFEKSGRGVREEVRKDVVATLEARGMKGAERTLSLLCSLEENSTPIITVDLFSKDWTAIRIGPDGITKVPLPPSFRRPKHLGPLWTPEVPFQGEPREVLLGFSKKIIPEPEDPRAHDLLVPALPALPLPIPRPILAFLGGHGSTKSFAQKMMARMILRKQAPKPKSRDPEDRNLLARENPILFFDNVNQISEDLAAFLCVCVTGEVVGGRERYTDKGTVYYGFRRAILLNGIAPNIHSYPDLADRCLVVKLNKIPRERRRGEKELEKELEPILPRVFSACLESLRRALPHLAQTREDLRGKLPRLADFAEWGEAIARGMGYKPMEWFSLYAKWIGKTVEETVEASALGRALLAFVGVKREGGEGERGEEGEDQSLRGRMERKTLQEKELENAVKEALGENKETGTFCSIGGKPAWVGTPTALLSELRHKLQELGEGKEEVEREEDFPFPKTPDQLGRRLRELQSSLLDVGVKVGFRREKRGRVIVIICEDVAGDTGDTTPIPNPPKEKEKVGEEEKGKEKVEKEGGKGIVNSVTGVTDVTEQPPTRGNLSKLVEVLERHRGGPLVEKKALAAELGITREQLDRYLEDPKLRRCIIDRGSWVEVF